MVTITNQAELEQSTGITDRLRVGVARGDVRATFALRDAFSELSGLEMDAVATGFVAFNGCEERIYGAPEGVGAWLTAVPIVGQGPAAAIEAVKTGQCDFSVVSAPMEGPMEESGVAGVSIHQPKGVRGVTIIMSDMLNAPRQKALGSRFGISAPAA